MHIPNNACFLLYVCYCVYGNILFLNFGVTDWFDGLSTFTKYICENDRLGGWYMPQKASYFALKLPQRWWIFGLDLALDGDIDSYQFQFFSNLVRKMVFFWFLYLKY